MLQAAWSGEHESAANYASLLLVALEQVSLDQGQWQVGWMMSLMEEPPDLIMARAPDRRAGAPLVRPFSGLADQQWATTALAYVRELDTIATRRREVAASGASRAPAARPRGLRPGGRRGAGPEAAVATAQAGEGAGQVSAPLTPYQWCRSVTRWALRARGPFARFALQCLKSPQRG